MYCGQAVSMKYFAEVYQSISCGLIIVVEVPKVNQIIRDPTNPRLYTVNWLTAYITLYSKHF